jgi:adenosyl cobinamide kinase/adenosyl cobinamide phosphate guanylyltransferase
MIQPETFKAIGDGLKTAWASVGPLVGVIIGAMLTRAWDRRKWINENRKQEYRELLMTLTSACTALIDNAQTLVQSSAEQISARDAYFNSLQVLQDRIFIANEIGKMNLFDRWGAAMKDLQETKDFRKFEDSFEVMKNEIVKEAMRV